MIDSLPGRTMPDGSSASLKTFSPMTSVWPALWPPWNRTITSAATHSQSTILPLPSSPHWAPTTTTFAIADPLRAAAIKIQNEQSPGNAAMATRGSLRECRTRKRPLSKAARFCAFRTSGGLQGLGSVNIAAHIRRRGAIRPGQGDCHDSGRTPDAHRPVRAHCGRRAPRREIRRLRLSSPTRCARSPMRPTSCPKP